MTEGFWQKVDRGKPNECWPWLGSRLPTGYGKLGDRYAHRIAYELSTGPITVGYYVCHHATILLCCNPAHLFQGTQRHNLADMLSKGRWGGGSFLGDLNPNAKLSSAQVAAVRVEHAEMMGSRPGRVRARRGWTSATALRLGITTTMLCLITSHRAWKE